MFFIIVVVLLQRYDLKADPHEFNDVHDREPQHADELKRHLFEWLQLYGGNPFESYVLRLICCFIVYIDERKKKNSINSAIQRRMFMQLDDSHGPELPLCGRIVL